MAKKNIAPTTFAKGTKSTGKVPTAPIQTSNRGILGPLGINQGLEWNRTSKTGKPGRNT
jgi:hypothetical protein